MAFPEPKPKKPELPKKLLDTLQCKQGAVRAVRFNGECIINHQTCTVGIIVRLRKLGKNALVLWFTRKLGSIV